MEPGNYSNFLLAFHSHLWYLLFMTPLEAELTAALEGSQRQVAEFRQENEFLRRKIDALVKRIFGARSEKIDPAQLELFMAGLDPAEGTPPAATGDSLTKSPVVAPPPPVPNQSVGRACRSTFRSSRNLSIPTSYWPTLPGSVSSIR